MEYRSGNDGDFRNIETFVWQAIFPAFNHPDLSEEQSAENDAIVAQAQAACLEAVALENKEVIVAFDRRERRLAGFVIADRASFTYPEISWLIVSRKYWGKGVADELLRRAISWLGTHKPIKAGVHYYLDRALRFFARYDFENTGEPAGEHLIPRILLIREAGPLEVPETVEIPEQLEIIPPEIGGDEVHNPLEPEEEELTSSPDADPLVTPEPILEIPAPDLFSVAEAAEVVAEEPAAEVVESAPAEKPYQSRYENIEFEIDYGEEEIEEEKKPEGLDFEFAFEQEPDEEAVEVPLELEVLEPEPDIVPSDTDEELSGHQVKDDGYQSSNADGEPIAEQPATNEEQATSQSADSRSKTGVPIEELREAFKTRFLSMTSDLFGEISGEVYWTQLQTSDFKEIAERSLTRLADSVSHKEDLPISIFEDLTEYFIVSVAHEEHGGIFPQRLLRHQTQEAEQIDLFTLINDYLELGKEQERVDTDFITISPKRLKNATKSFLLARPGERIYFLIDQSLLGNLKNGFAFTDQAFYWKAMLQPNHVAYYKELKEVRMEKGAVQINGHFFDTGKRNLNLKVVMLLKRLARL